MNLLLAAAMLLATSAGGGAEVIEAPRTSQPRGPGNASSGYTYHPPLPKPASQAKRRRQGRRSHR